MALRPATGTLDGHVPATKVAGVWQKWVQAQHDNNPSPPKKSKSKRKNKQPTVPTESGSDDESSTENTNDGDSNSDNDLQELDKLSAQDKLVHYFFFQIYSTNIFYTEAEVIPSCS